MQTTIELAEAIRIAIRRSGRTAQDIAAAMHVSARTVSNWQTGATAPKFDDVVRLAAITKQPLELFADAIEVRTFADVLPGQVAMFPAPQPAPVATRSVDELDAAA